MVRICIFAGSRLGVKPDYVEVARQVGRAVATRGWGVVYGGACIGLMGALADSALEAGGEVIGVVPRGLFATERPHRGLTRIHTVGSMHKRKALMADIATGFLALPGGFGTFDELFETITWAQIGIHRKPIALLNAAGYFDPLMTLIRFAHAEGFIDENDTSTLMCDSDISALLDYIAESMARNKRRHVLRDVSVEP